MCPQNPQGRKWAHSSFSLSGELSCEEGIGVSDTWVQNHLIIHIGFAHKRGSEEEPHSLTLILSTRSASAADSSAEEEPGGAASETREMSEAIFPPQALMSQSEIFLFSSLLSVSLESPLKQKTCRAHRKTAFFPPSCEFYSPSSPTHAPSPPAPRPPQSPVLASGCQ